MFAFVDENQSGFYGIYEGGVIVVIKNTNMGDSVAHHRNICSQLNELYAKKNQDYGDSFHKSYLEEGMAMARIRLGDKLNRFKALTMNSGARAMVKDESIRDTLIDLANYAIMTVMEIDNKDAAKKCASDTPVQR